MRRFALMLLALAVLKTGTTAQVAVQRAMPKKDLLGSRGIQNLRPQQVEARKLFGLVQQSIVDGSLSCVASSFAQQVSVNLPGGESGHFSASQAVSVLQRYLSVRSQSSFEFSRFSDVGPTPYATGRLTSIARGRRESSQIYVSLRLQGSRWVINQFNIY